MPEIRWVFILGVVNLLSFVMRAKKYSMNRIMDTKTLRLLIGFSVVMFLVGFISVWPEKHWEIIDKQFKVFIFIILLYKSIDTPTKFEAVLWVYLTGVFYIAWVAHDIGRTGNGRLEGVGSIDSTDANDLAAIFVTAVPILFFHLLEGKTHLVKIVAFVFLIFVLNGIVLAGSRGAFIGLLISMVIFLLKTVFFVKEKGFSFKIKVFIGILVCCSLFLYLSDQTFWTRMSTLLEKETPDSDYNRVIIWEYAIDLALRHPLGIGAWGYTYLSYSFLPTDVMGNSSLKAIHSTYLEVLTSFGFIGFLIFVKFIYSSFSEIRDAQRILRTKETYLLYQGYALISAYIGFLICCIFINRLYCEVLYYFPAFFVVFHNIYKNRSYAVVDNYKLSKPSPLPR
ncbi:MAG: O-antigen ligase family protein [Confluentibacter sp.]|nr:O-antigen ligase family protein [Confluentibacter sp.]